MIDAVAVIPVRLGSKRIPAKALTELAGKSLLQHVWEQTCQAECFARVVVATDSSQVVALAESWGASAIYTDRDCLNGTERIAEIASQLESEYVVNVQGDMPVVPSSVFRQLLNDWERTAEHVITPIYQLRTTQELLDPILVKVALSSSGRALYFSRSPIPHLRDVPMHRWVGQQTYWGHIGIYGYTKNVLRRYLDVPAGFLESAESLEQLRFLDAGIAIETTPVCEIPMRIDSPADLQDARARLNENTPRPHLAM